MGGRLACASRLSEGSFRARVRAVVARSVTKGIQQKNAVLTFEKEEVGGRVGLLESWGSSGALSVARSIKFLGHAAMRFLLKESERLSLHSV